MVGSGRRPRCRFARSRFSRSARCAGCLRVGQAGTCQHGRGCGRVGEQSAAHQAVWGVIARGTCDARHALRFRHRVLYSRHKPVTVDATMLSLSQGTSMTTPARLTLDWVRAHLERPCRPTVSIEHLSCEKARVAARAARRGPSGSCTQGREAACRVGPHSIGRFLRDRCDGLSDLCLVWCLVFSER